MQCRRCRFDPCIRKIAWRRDWLLTPLFFPGESHGQRRLVGYNPWMSQRVSHDWPTNHILFSIVVKPTYISTNSIQEFSSLHILVNFCYLWIFNETHSDRCEVIYHSGIDNTIYIKECSTVFLSRNCIVLGLTFRPLIYIEFIFVFSVKNFLISHSLHLHVAFQFSQHHLLERLFLHCKFLFLCHRLIDSECMGLFPGSYSILLIYIYLFLCQPYCFDYWSFVV